jgi:hypothetical protein
VPSRRCSSRPSSTPSPAISPGCRWRNASRSARRSPDATLQDRARALAAGSRGVYQRAGPLFLVLAQAAPLDAELAALWERARARRLEDCRRLVQLAGRGGPAARGKLADLLFVYSGPGAYADLTGDRGWTGEAYEAWLAAAVEDLLGG